MMNKKVAANTGNPFTTPIFPTDFQMKNLIITSFLIFGLFTKAQQIELIENTWYLDKLTINNVDFFPPNNDEVSHSDITASFTNFLVTATSGCNWLNGEAIYGNENIFEMVVKVGMLLFLNVNYLKIKFLNTIIFMNFGVLTFKIYPNLFIMKSL